MAPLIPLWRCHHFFLISDCDIYTEAEVHFWLNGGQGGWGNPGKMSRERKISREKREGKWPGEMTAGRVEDKAEREGKTDGEGQVDVHLFGEALTVLILIKDVKLIRFISNVCM